MARQVLILAPRASLRVNGGIFFFAVPTLPRPPSSASPPRPLTSSQSHASRECPRHFRTPFELSLRANLCPGNPGRSGQPGFLPSLHPLHKLPLPIRLAHISTLPRSAPPPSPLPPVSFSTYISTLEASRGSFVFFSIVHRQLSVASAFPFVRSLSTRQRVTVLVTGPHHTSFF